MAPRAGEAVQTPSSGNSVRGEVDQKSASRGVGRQVPGQQDRSGGRGGLQGGGVEAETEQEWAVSRTDAQEQGKGCLTPS